MNFLIIERDEMVSGRLENKLKALGHTVTCEQNKSAASEILTKSNKIDILIVDPSPMKDPSAIIMSAKRGSLLHPYVFWLHGDEEEPVEADLLKSGANDTLTKSCTEEILQEKIEQAALLRALADHLADRNEDFPSAGGVIAKSAYNQLFISSMERSGRYNERSYVLNIRLANYKEIRDMDGPYPADYAASAMASHLVRLRRLSDIIGQTRINEYSLLLQRVIEEEEAVDAAKRFSVALEEAGNIVPDSGPPVLLEVELLHLPSGRRPYKYQIRLKK